MSPLIAIDFLKNHKPLMFIKYNLGRSNMNTRYDTGYEYGYKGYECKYRGFGYRIQYNIQIQNTTKDMDNRKVDYPILIVVSLVFENYK